jgi:hypothetical protein
MDRRNQSFGRFQANSASLLIDGKGDAIREPDPETVGNVVARLLYVLERGYLEEPQFQRWRARKMREAGVSGTHR